MDLDELRSFLTVVDEGSLARAASVLLVSRTTIRRRIEALEARVGRPLFGRTHAGVVLTDAGELLAARGRLFLREAELLAEALRDARREPSGVMRIAVPPGLPPFLLQPVIASSRARYPRLHIHLTVTEQPLRALLDTVDLAVVFGEVPADGPWGVLPVVPLREWLVASEAYLARHGEPRTLDDLAAHEILVWRPPDRDPRDLPTRGGSLRVDPGVVSPDVHWLRHCAMAGMGLVYVPDGLLPDPTEGAVPLRPVLVDVVGRRFDATVAFSKIRATSPEMRAVLTDMVPMIERARALLERLQPG